MQKPSLAKGMRDFSPEQFREREYIFSTIKSLFSKYGFLPIETPAIENIQTLTGKYGNEGDKLLFRILNSGDFLSSVDEKIISEKNHRSLTPLIAEKGLRYDLTVPLARFVVMNRNEIAFPFKRYHIDRVWRADRPQRGRYREFYQCDADVIGSASLLYDAECILLLDDVLGKLNMPPFAIKLNNRKILNGLAEEWGFIKEFNSFTIAIDKLDKIGEDGVIKELAERGFSETQLQKTQQLFRLTGITEEKITKLKSWIQSSETGKKGIAELQEVLSFLENNKLKRGEVQLDISLSRGLDYYTSTIYEVVLNTVKMGSIASGGRYDELTAGFGVPDMPGVGISFGAERIYDIMKELNLFPELPVTSVKILLANFGNSEEKKAFTLLNNLRAQGVAAEMYPSSAKLGKQIQYAVKKGITYILIAGEEEFKSGKYQLKYLETGVQESKTIDELVNMFTAS